MADAKLLSMQVIAVMTSAGMFSAAPVAGQHAHDARVGSKSDSAAVAEVVHEYHQALAAGDSLAALSLLADDAVILESGGMESRSEYRAHHLESDINYARAVASERSPVRVAVRDDVAWAISTSTTRGEYRDRTINSRGAELMVLTRTPEGWRIAAIHWSSRSLRN